MKGKLNGNRFFGLYTSDYRDAIERLDNGPSGLVEPSVLAECPIDKALPQTKTFTPFCSSKEYYKTSVVTHIVMTRLDWNRF